MDTKKSKMIAGVTISGAPIQIYCYTVDSGKTGPVIYIQGGMHGGEVTYWIFEALNKSLQKNLKKGKVILVPIANPISWQQRSYFYTFGKYDTYMGIDWNRNFPGNDNGSLGEKIAKQLFTKAKNTDLAIDLHTSRHSFPFGIFFSNKHKELAKTLGLKYNYFKDLEVEPHQEYFKTFSGALLKSGTDSFTIECGSHDAYEPENIEQIVSGIEEIFRSKQMYIGKAKQKAVMGYDQLKTYFIPSPGFVIFKMQVGTEFNKGDLLYEIHNNFEITKIYAEEDGVLEKTSPTHIYWPGDEVLEVIPKERIYKL